MTIDKLTPLGENGSLESETTFDAWVDGGFVDERVRYTRLNRQFNRADTKINELRDYGPSVGAPDDTSSETYTAEVFTPDTSMMSPFDTGLAVLLRVVNNLRVFSSPFIVSLCPTNITEI